MYNLCMYYVNYIRLLHLIMITDRQTIFCRLVECVPGLNSCDTKLQTPNLKHLQYFCCSKAKIKESKNGDKELKMTLKSNYRKHKKFNLRFH